MAKKATKNKKVVPASIAELKPDKNNPRRIEAAAAAGLDSSLVEFGDISGITFNTKTNELVAGHKRVEALLARYGELSIDKLDDERGTIETPDGKSFVVRFVEWDRSTQVAANVAANSPTIQGTFVEDDLSTYLLEIKTDNSDLYDSLLLDELAVDTKAGDEGRLVNCDIEAPPEMVWVLIGIAATDYGMISETVAAVAEIDQTVVSMSTEFQKKA